MDDYRDMNEQEKINLQKEITILKHKLKKNKKKLKAAREVIASLLKEVNYHV